MIKTTLLIGFSPTLQYPQSNLTPWTLHLHVVHGWQASAPESGPPRSKWQLCDSWSGEMESNCYFLHEGGLKYRQFGDSVVGELLKVCESFVLNLSALRSGLYTLQNATDKETQSILVSPLTRVQFATGFKAWSRQILDEELFSRKNQLGSLSSSTPCWNRHTGL